jgi:hypothetical protein
MRAEFRREDLHEPDDAVLGSRVVRGVRAQARGRAGEDEAAALSALDHGGQRRAHRVEDAGQVDVDHLGPLALRHLPADRPRADPGVRADDVDPAELGQARLDRLLQLAERADVAIALTARRPLASTSRTVASRSSSVDSEYDRVSRLSAQMSTAITSAPSAASRTACERPCPRAAPVTSATFPSTSPTLHPPSL